MFAHEEGFGELKVTVYTHRDVNVLAIETSCDETACSIVRNGREVLSNAIFTQMHIHREYGGVVPEIASRNHLEKINDVVDKAILDAGLHKEDIDVIAVTSTPGLIGALVVGVATAKTMAYALSKPLVGVHHIAGHIAANYLDHGELEPPFISLVISGGHTSVIDVKDYNEHEVIGQTLDDAAGEAFDKVGILLGLTYPAGKDMDELARSAIKNDVSPVYFKRTYLEKRSPHFSFSGIKTGVMNYIRANKDDPIDKEAIALGFHEAVTDVLVKKTVDIAKRRNRKKIVLAGGVAANSFIRNKFKEEGEAQGFEVYLPGLGMCTDNAAMIASAGYYKYISGGISDYYLDAVSNTGLQRRILLKSRKQRFAPSL